MINWKTLLHNIHTIANVTHCVPSVQHMDNTDRTEY